MLSKSTARIDVLVRLKEPLLAAGVIASLRCLSDVHIAGDTVGREESAPIVFVTDQLWDEEGGLSLGPGIRPPWTSETRLLALCPQAREHFVGKALRSGVHGLLRSSCTIQELIHAVYVLAKGARYVCPEIAQHMATTLHREALTSREAEVLRLLSRGRCNKTIARDLGIAVGTVKTHVKSILVKLDASSRTEAASIAAEKGLVDIPEFRGHQPAPDVARWFDESGGASQSIARTVAASMAPSAT